MKCSVLIVTGISPVMVDGFVIIYLISRLVMIMWRLGIGVLKEVL